MAADALSLSVGGLFLIRQAISILGAYFATLREYSGLLGEYCIARVAPCISIAVASQLHCKVTKKRNAKQGKKVHKKVHF